jgi:FkbM family methyltransferase
MLNIWPTKTDAAAIKFCSNFIHSQGPKYIFGINQFAESIANHVDVTGFIDDFTSETEWLQKPIIRTKDVEHDALVVVAVIMGKPLTAERNLRQYNSHYIDYFAFYRYSGLPIKQIIFWDGFIDDFHQHRAKYEYIHEILFDRTSKDQFEKIINFRLSYNIEFMEGFKAIEEQQYFEDFLDLEEEGEVFVDVGGYDGYTSQEFIRYCPKYELIHFFEPEEGNLFLAKQKLAPFKKINFYNLGLSNAQQTSKFDSSGSSSKINGSGTLTIHVNKLDHLLQEKITFLKMDIEGAEREAIEGASELIKRYHPRLAISVYHRHDDFWQIPEQILSIRDDYAIYLRHYTEGIAETVMFFIPRR